MILHEADLLQARAGCSPAAQPSHPFEAAKQDPPPPPHYSRGANSLAPRYHHGLSMRVLTPGVACRGVRARWRVYAKRGPGLPSHASCVHSCASRLHSATYLEPVLLGRCHSERLGLARASGKLHGRACCQCLPICCGAARAGATPPPIPQSGFPSIRRAGTVHVHACILY